jgi:hypothetical protein
MRRAGQLTYLAVSEFRRCLTLLNIPERRATPGPGKTKVRPRRGVREPGPAGQETASWSWADASPAGRRRWSASEHKRTGRSLSRPVSRILCDRLRGPAVIPLGRRLPGGSSDLYPEAWGEQPASLFGLAPGGVYLASAVTGRSGELLPHRFTLAATPSRRRRGGLFSVALSPPRDGPSLSATLLYGVRTFLPHRLIRCRRLPVRLRLQRQV